MSRPSARDGADIDTGMMQRWRRIEELHQQPGPFDYTATRTSLKVVPLG